jgi:hypothetical protein
MMLREHVAARPSKSWMTAEFQALKYHQLSLRKWNEATNSVSAILFSLEEATFVVLRSLLIKIGRDFEHFLSNISKSCWRIEDTLLAPALIPHRSMAP